MRGGDEASSSGGPLRGGARQRATQGQSLVDAGGDEADVDPGVEFKKHIARLFLRSKFSGPETVSLIKKAFDAGASGLDDVASAACHGKHMQNARRDLMVKFLKGVSFPDIYWQDIPLWNPDKQVLELVQFPFLLPHELFAKMIESGGTDTFDLNYENKELHQMKLDYCKDVGIGPSTFIGVGIHGDGVPHQTSGSVEVFPWIFVGSYWR